MDAIERLLAELLHEARETNRRLDLLTEVVNLGPKNGTEIVRELRRLKHTVGHDLGLS